MSADEGVIVCKVLAWGRTCRCEERGYTVLELSYNCYNDKKRDELYWEILSKGTREELPRV